MAEIRFDADQAQRIIAQMIRDEGGLLPAKANTLAASICSRLPGEQAIHTITLIDDWKRRTAG